MSATLEHSYSSIRSFSPIADGNTKHLMRTIRRIAGRIVGALRDEHYRIWHMAGRSRTIDGYLSTHAVRRLHLGAGPNLLAGWLNSDIRPASREVIYLDIREELPFDDGTLDRIFSEHLIEHVSHAEAAAHLVECCRVLRPGGVLRVATPDLNVLVEVYRHRMNNTDVERRYIDRTIRNSFSTTGFHHAGFVVNNFLHDWGHQFIYDGMTLHEALSPAGFANITRCAVQSSSVPDLQGLEGHGNSIGDEFNRMQTMVFEATRP